MNSLCALLLAMLAAQLPLGAKAANAATGATDPAAPTSASGFSSISLERTECYGRCPTYVLTIAGDGQVEFVGKDNVVTKGKGSAMLSADQIKRLAAAVDAADFFALRDRYQSKADGCPGMWSDNPSVIVQVEVRGKRKSIQHDLGCRGPNSQEPSYPKALTALEDDIDRIVDSRRWIGGSEAPWAR